MDAIRTRLEIMDLFSLATIYCTKRNKMFVRNISGGGGWWDRGRGARGALGDLKTRLAIYPIWEYDTCPVGPSTTTWPDQE